MCLPGGDKAAKRAAAEQKAAEEKRRASIAQGTAAIDQSLAGFDDTYFQGRQDAYSANYKPQLEDQYNQAYKDLVYSLSNKNLLRSTVAGDKMRELQEKRAEYERQIGSEAQNFANQGRTDLENTRSNLLSQLYATEDPSQATAAAARQAQLLNTPASFDTAGNFLFNVADSLNTVNQATGGQGVVNALTRNIGTGAGKGSARTVRV